VRHIEGIDYCSAHDDVWYDDETQCQAIYFDRAENDEDKCVGHPLWWGNLPPTMNPDVNSAGRRLVAFALGWNDYALTAAEQEPTP